MKHRRWIAAGALAGGLTAIAAGQLKMTNGIPGFDVLDLSTRPTATRLDPRLGDEEEREIFTTIGNSVFPAGRVVIANNGGLGFGSFPTLPSDDLGPVEEPLPSLAAFGGGQSLLPYWDDLGNSSGDVYYEELPGRLIVQWHNKIVNQFPATTVRFQAQIFAGPSPVLSEDGPETDGDKNGPSTTGTGPPCFAQFIYMDIQGVAACGDSATIGYQDGGRGFNDVQWSHRESGAVGDGTVLSLCLDKGDPCARWNPYAPVAFGFATVQCDRDERLLVALQPTMLPSGVSFALGAVQAFRLDWLYFEPPWSPQPVQLPNGAWLELRAFGQHSTMSGAPVGHVRIMRNFGQYFVTTDFSPVDASLHRIRAYRRGVLVASLNDRIGTAAVAPRWPESGQAGLFGQDADFTLRWCAPLTVQLPGAGLVELDELRLIAQEGAPVAAQQRLELAASQFVPVVPPGLERPIVLVNRFVTPLRVPADMNCDGRVDFDDIEGFVLALVSRSAYYARYPECNVDNADIDGDGAVSFDDVDGFVACVIAGACP